MQMRYSYEMAANFRGPVVPEVHIVYWCILITIYYLFACVDLLPQCLQDPSS